MHMYMNIMYLDVKPVLHLGIMAFASQQPGLSQLYILSTSEKQYSAQVYIYTKLPHKFKVNQALKFQNTSLNVLRFMKSQ